MESSQIRWNSWYIYAKGENTPLKAILIQQFLLLPALALF